MVTQLLAFYCEIFRTEIIFKIQQILADQPLGHPEANTVCCYKLQKRPFLVFKVKFI